MPFQPKAGLLIVRTVQHSAICWSLRHVYIRRRFIFSLVSVARKIYVNKKQFCCLTQLSSYVCSTYVFNSLKTGQWFTFPNITPTYTLFLESKFIFILQTPRSLKLIFFFMIPTQNFYFHFSYFSPSILFSLTLSRHKSIALIINEYKILNNQPKFFGSLQQLSAFWSMVMLLGSTFLTTSNFKL
jgi:hypothetical protein